MDNLRYTYKFGTNQLDHVKDAVSANNYSIDIDNQDTLNYTYDQIGNLKKDKAEGIDTIIWTVYGKIAKIVKSNGIIINYTYDAAGNRISKVVNAKMGGKKVTWYVRDASGNVMSVYSKNDSINNGHLMQSEVHLYGSSRLGIWESERDMQDTAILLQNGMIMFKRDKKRYELNNHLGNVLVTVSDRKIPISYNGTTIDHYEAYVMNAQDFYPFGMVMVGRGYVKSVGYRYGFGTQERSTEINENSYTAEFWQYDARIGRRWNTDKRPNVSISPYNCFAGNPIWYNDIKGDTITGENGFDKAAYRAGLVEHIDLLKKYKKDGLPGGMAVNEKNLNGKLNEMNAALNTFDALEARKDIIVVRKGDAATNPNEAWTNFNIAQNAPRVDIGTGVKDADFYLISHELQHVEDYFNGGFSFAANGAGGILVDIYDEIGPNNRQEVLRSGIIAASPNPTVWTNKTLPNRVFSDGTTPYNVLPKDKRVLSDPKWSSFLKTETAKSVQENTPQPHFYVGFEKDRADAEAAKKAEEAKKK